MSDTFFVPDGEGFFPQVHATGPWSADFLHGGPPCALVTRSFERKFPDDFQITRLTFELLRPVPFKTLTVRTEVETEGANVRRGTATLEADGKVCIRATAMAFRKVGVEAALPPEAPPALPATLKDTPMPFFITPVGYHSAMDVRFARGALGTSPVAVWMRMKLPLLPGEKPSPFVRLVCAADSGNGVAQPLDLRAFTFINADLTLSLLRRPKGEWICLDTHSLVTKDGMGLADTRLWDEQGPVGRGAQSLVIRPRAATPTAG